MKRISFDLDKISVLLIILLPVGLLISSGVSETIGILIAAIFIIKSIYKNNL